MTIHLPFSAQEEASLRERAAAAGTDLTGFIREAVAEKLEAPAEPLTEHSDLTVDQRVAEWLAWTASHRALGYVVDDSRESIYAGRGE